MATEARFKRFFLGPPPSQQGGEAVKNANNRERLGFAAASETLRGRKRFLSANAACCKGFVAKNFSRRSKYVEF